MRGAKETRTPDPLLAKQVLFQLSYSPSAAWAALFRVPVVAGRRELGRTCRGTTAISSGS
jgi:hypothetical protein